MSRLIPLYHFVIIRKGYFGSQFWRADENEPRVAWPFASRIHDPETAMTVTGQHILGRQWKKLRFASGAKRTVVKLILPLKVMHAHVGRSRNARFGDLDFVPLISS